MALNFLKNSINLQIFMNVGTKVFFNLCIKCPTNSWSFQNSSSYQANSTFKADFVFIKLLKFTFIEIMLG